MKISHVVFFIFYTFCGSGQGILTPGRKSFEKKWIQAEHYQMKWYILMDTVKREIGTITTDISIDKKYFLMVTQVEMQQMKSPWVDSTQAQLPDLAPIFHSSYNSQRDMRLVYGETVTGFYNDKTKKNSTSIREVTKEKYFDSNLYPALIRWLPLQEGYAQDISIFDYNPSSKIGVIKASVTNTQEGMYASKKSGQHPVWVVTVQDEIGGDAVSTYYIDKATRKLWKQAINAGSRKMIMEVIE